MIAAFLSGDTNTTVADLAVVAVLVGMTVAAEAG
jgi:hypothetical protein